MWLHRQVQCIHFITMDSQILAGLYLPQLLRGFSLGQAYIKERPSFLISPSPVKTPSLVNCYVDKFGTMLISTALIPSVQQHVRWK